MRTSKALLKRIAAQLLGNRNPATWEVSAVKILKQYGEDMLVEYAIEYKGEEGYGFQKGKHLMCGLVRPSGAQTSFTIQPIKR